MMKHSFFLIALFLLVFPASARAWESEVPDRLAIVTAAGKTHIFNIELAQTPVETVYGLMYRDTLAVDAGMLFIFPDERERSFWMKNTLIPLDMLFIKSDGTILSIQRDAKPRDLTPLPSNGPVRFVLEINGGQSAALGINPGDVAHHATFNNAIGRPAASP